jgi:hypothetical protein
MKSCAFNSSRITSRYTRDESPKVAWICIHAAFQNGGVPCTSSYNKINKNAHEGRIIFTIHYKMDT